MPHPRLFAGMNAPTHAYHPAKAIAMPSPLHHSADDGQAARPPASPHACPSLTVLAAWCEDNLEPAEREAIDVHIAGCPLCVELVAGLGVDTEAFGGELTADHAVAGRIEPTSPEFDALTRRAIALVPLASESAKRGGASLSWRFIASAVAASLAFAALGSWMGYRVATTYRSSGFRQTATADDATVASNIAAGYGLFDGGSTADALSDPLELLASRLLAGSSS